MKSVTTDVPMYLWEKIGFATVAFLNIFGPIIFVIWYINVNHIPLLREDINDPEVIKQGIIGCSVIILLFSIFFLWIFGVFGKWKETIMNICSKIK